jgi:hypothetical protein
VAQEGEGEGEVAADPVDPRVGGLGGFIDAVST